MKPNNLRLSGLLHLRRLQEILSFMCPKAELSTEASRTCLGFFEIPGLCQESADMDHWSEGEVRRGFDVVTAILLQSFPFLLET